MELGTFFVNQVIVHQIPKTKLADKEENPPILSQVPSPLTQSLKAYFRARIIASLRTKPFRAIYDDSIESPIPESVVAFHADDIGENFVPMSQAIARFLHGVQTGSNSAGILALVDGTVGQGPDIGRCLAIMKLEMEGALTIAQSTVDGKATFALRVEEVTLNEAANVFKAAIFSRATTLASVSATVSDNQRDEASHGPEVASFFMRFLGCKLAPAPQRATKEYIERAEEYINAIEDEEKRVRYELALLGDLAKPSSVIDPTAFVEEYFDADDRDSFVDMFKDDDGVTAAFDKDVSLVKARLNFAQITYSNGLKLTGPREAVQESVTIEDEQTVVRATVKRVGRS